MKRLEESEKRRLHTIKLMEAAAAKKDKENPRKEMTQVERLKELENRIIPEVVDYKTVGGLGREAVEKLNKHRPRTFGQALRLDGVTPSDLSLLSVHLANSERHAVNVARHSVS